MKHITTTRPFLLFFPFLFFFATAALATPTDYSSLFSPLPEVELPSDEAGRAKLELGKKLYRDSSLSIARDISCASCHRLEGFGVDNEATSPGHLGKRGERNSPSSFNAYLHVSQFWDGRAEDVEAQALGPVLNPVEMAMPEEAVVVERLKQSQEYQELFRKAFPDVKEPVSFLNMGKAIGAFERILVTPSRFDSYLKGDDKALSEAEKEGLKSFVAAGCNACHTGPALGGLMYQKIGLVKPYPTKDLGRYNVTGKDADKYVFKVPSLRNIEKTGPYFHDGSVKSLEEAVRLMGKYQLGREFTPQEVEQIVVFLKSLTGSLPEDIANFLKVND